VTIALVGGALWLKATLAGFLRFWIARICYEQHAQADRIAAAVTGAPPGGDTVSANPTSHDTPQVSRSGR
jgi:hypothetical protein